MSKETKQVSKKIAYWASVTVVGIVLGVSLQFVKAWTEPSSSAPGGNVDAPINKGNLTQYKEGALGLGGVFHTLSNAIVDGQLKAGGIESTGTAFFREYRTSAVFSGNVGIGTTSPQFTLDVNGSGPNGGIHTSGKLKVDGNMSAEGIYPNRIEIMSGDGIKFKDGSILTTAKQTPRALDTKHDEEHCYWAGAAMKNVINLCKDGYYVAGIRNIGDSYGSNSQPWCCSISYDTIVRN